MIDTNTAVGILAASHPRLRLVLEELGIDYCCSGNRSLADAAAAEGLPIQQVIDAIARAPEGSGPHNVVWFDRSLADVVAHVAEHHRAVSLDVLAQSAVLFEIISEAKLLDAELLDPLRHTFHQFVNQLTPHIEREERIIFPFIETMEEAWERGTPPPPRFEGGLRAAIAPVCLEHESMGEALRQFRAGRALLICIDDRACRHLEHLLRNIERELHEAMNIENFVLYPRAIELEDQVCSGAEMIAVKAR